MNLINKIESMSNEQLKSIWKLFETQSWCGADMYDKNISMDEWGMMIVSEMDDRGLNKF